MAMGLKIWGSDGSVKLDTTSMLSRCVFRVNHTASAGASGSHDLPYLGDHEVGIGVMGFLDSSSTVLVPPSCNVQITHDETNDKSVLWWEFPDPVYGGPGDVEIAVFVLD